MNLTCPNCATVYRVDPAKVPEAGVRARCAVCSAIFRVARETEDHSVSRPDAPATAAPVQAPAVAPSAPPAAEPGGLESVSSEPAMSAVTPAPVAPADRDGAAARSPQPPRPAIPPPAGTRPPAVSPRPSGPPPPAIPVPAGAAVRPGMPARPAGAVAPAVQTAPRRPVNPFLSQDPSQKARRLARALISDMVVYHPAKRREGLRDGTLKQLFEEEIKKSWEEYTEQVGRDVAESTVHFREALNEILADGRQIF